MPDNADVSVAADNKIMDEMQNAIVYRLHNHPNMDHPYVTVDRAAAGAVISKLGARLKPAVNGRAAFEIPAIIIDLFASDFKIIVQSLGGIDQAIAVAQQAYKQYVEPIDLPNVPNFIEPTVDHAICFSIGTILREYWNKLNAAPPAPVTLPPVPVGSDDNVGSVRTDY